MIEDVQKFRFLKNLYKSAYAYGNKIDETTVKRLYSLYFRNNTPGAPVQTFPEQMRETNRASVDQLNYIMAASIFNIDVLYDSMNDAIENLFEVVTSTNNRINQLRSKRLFLEKKVDDMIFAISNSDGYYASFTEEFADLSGIDLKLSSAYLDSDSRTVHLPSISSSDRTKISGNYFKLANTKMTIRFNGTVVVDNQQIGDSGDLMFDGLSDTYWSHTYSSASNGLVTLQLDFTPLGTGSLSRIFVRLTSEKRIKLIANLTVSTSDGQKQITVQGNSSLDDDNFVFNFTPSIVKSFSLFFVKNEPDRISKNARNPYEYDFLIRDVILSGEYYDYNAVYVSNPIRISNTGNIKNVIDAVSIDAELQNVDTNFVDFYIAQNVPLASSINDFKWIPISLTNFSNKSYSNVVNFYGKTLDYKILSELDSSIVSPVVLKTLSTTASLEIPGYENIPIYQVAELDPNTNYIEPIVLSGFGKIQSYIHDYEDKLCDSLQTWTNNIIPDSSTNGLQVSSFEYQKSSVFWSAPGIQFGGSALLSFELLCSSDAILEDVVMKNDKDSVLWDMAIYLNGALVKKLNSGQAQDTIQWSFKKGKNTVHIAIDAKPKQTSNENGGLIGELILTKNNFISDYGLIYLNYLSNVNPQIYKNKNQIANKTFAIDMINNKKYLISNSAIEPGSRIYYHVINSANKVDSIRVRADLTRSSNSPLNTPAIVSYRVKFKSSQMLTTEATKSAVDVLFER